MSLYVWQYVVDGESSRLSLILGDIHRALDEELDMEFYVFSKLIKH